ncbi:MAG: hypothetical protein EZS28_012314, partial [Streblomastix strix]
MPKRKAGCKLKANKAPITRKRGKNITKILIPKENQGRDMFASSPTGKFIHWKQEVKIGNENSNEIVSTPTLQRILQTTSQCTPMQMGNERSKRQMKEKSPPHNNQTVIPYTKKLSKKYIKSLFNSSNTRTKLKSHNTDKEKCYRKKPNKRTKPLSNDDAYECHSDDRCNKTTNYANEYWVKHTEKYLKAKKEWEEKQRENPEKKIKEPRKPFMLWMLLFGVGTRKLLLGQVMFFISTILSVVQPLLMRELLKAVTNKQLDPSTVFPYASGILIIL